MSPGEALQRNTHRNFPLVRGLLRRRGSESSLVMDPWNQGICSSSKGPILGCMFLGRLQGFFSKHTRPSISCEW
ncbi:hypothetical protein EYF80_044765 [Liparis tanakae]|uniref:Uncharacterized protein n=1 Tax=Liparis tanakae TaxID=230148 RepID=A0A4Z2FV57_9TELE|nr:hypothetical protein EYF80_044765 [Liparis tanakae]